MESGQILEELVVRVTATNASGDPASFVNAEQLSTRAGAISLAQAGTNQNHLFRVEVVEVDDATREIRYTALGNESTLLSDILYRFGDQSLTGQQRQFEVISATDNGGSVGSDEDTTTPVSGHLVANLVLFSRSNAPTVSIDGDLHRTSSFDEGDTFMGGSNGFKLFNIAWGASTNDESKGEYFATVKLTVSGLADGANEKLSLAHDDFPSDPNNVVRNYIDLVNGQGTHNISISGWSETVNTDVSVTGDTATVLISGNFDSGQLQNLLAKLEYSNTSDDPTAQDRVITLVSVQDSGSDAYGGVNSVDIGATHTIAVSSVNDPAVLSGNGDSHDFYLGDSAITLFTNASATPIEASQTIERIQIELSDFTLADYHQLTLGADTLTLSGNANDLPSYASIDNTQTVDMFNGISGIYYDQTVSNETVTITQNGNPISVSGAVTFDGKDVIINADALESVIQNGNVQITINAILNGRNSPSGNLQSQAVAIDLTYRFSNSQGKIVADNYEVNGQDSG